MRTFEKICLLVLFSFSLAVAFCFFTAGTSRAANGLIETLKDKAGQPADQSGSILVFSSDRTGTWEIWAADPDGSKPRKLTGGPGEKGDPNLSPDGNYVVYVTRDSGTGELWIVSIDGANQRELTSLGGFSRNPSWSRDGKRVAFSFSQDEEPYNRNSIREMHLETQKITTILESKNPGETGVTWFLNHPVYAADENVLFHTRAEIATPGFPKYTAVGIFKTDLNSGTTTSVTGGPFYYDEGGTIHGHWSTCPDLGEMDLPLVFTAIVGYTEGSICFASLDGKRVRRVLRDEGIMYRNPAVSSNGRFIYYEKADGNTSQIFLLDTVKGESTRITSEGNNRTPDF